MAVTEYIIWTAQDPQNKHPTSSHSFFNWHMRLQNRQLSSTYLRTYHLNSLPTNLLSGIPLLLLQKFLNLKTATNMSWLALILSLFSQISS